MAINVYWACLEDEWMRCKEPTSVIKDFYQTHSCSPSNKLMGMNFCPSFNLSLKNTYALKSLYNYNFSIIDGKVGSSMHDQKFYNNHVIERSIEEKFFSFTQMKVFFTDDASLKMTVGQFPFLEDNNITKRCAILPGTFDIGKWFRPIDFSFYLKKEYNEFTITEDEIYSYITFHTDQTINLKQFYPSPTVKQHLSDVLLSKRYLVGKKTLENFYSMFRTKHLILNEIKKNLI
jgi:hypothetical protein